MQYLITRHYGALVWMRRRLGKSNTHLAHLQNLELIQAGDGVYGTLPIHLVAELCKRGAYYFHLEVNIPEAFRGEELSADRLDQFGAQLVEYVAHRPICDEAIAQQIATQEDY